MVFELESAHLSLDATPMIVPRELSNVIIFYLLWSAQQTQQDTL